MRKTNVCIGEQPLLSKGFTLIELLAVLVILAIIALIATPIILNTIKDSKEKSVMISVQNYLRAVEVAVMNKDLDKETKSLDGYYNIESQGKLIRHEQYQGNTINIEYNGEGPTSGKIKILNGSVSKGTILQFKENNIVMNEYKKLEILPVPVSFEDDSWATIAANVKAGNIDVYKSNLKENKNNTKEVTLEGFGTYTVRIANTSTPDECNTEGFSQTACGFVIEFVDIITTHNFNPAGEYKGVQYDSGWNVDGYPSSSMYKFLNDTTDDTITSIYESLPEDLKYVIIDTKVISGHGKTAGETNFTSTDKLYILAPKEVYGIKADYDTLDETRQLDYYEKKEVTTSKCPECAKECNGGLSWWWFRSPVSYTNTHVFAVMSTGNLTYNLAKSTIGVAPAFRIG